MERKPWSVLALVLSCLLLVGFAAGEHGPAAPSAHSSHTAHSSH